MNRILFRQSVPADGIEDFEMRSSCITEIGPKSSGKYPYKKQKRTDTDTEEKAVGREKQRLERYVATGQGITATGS